MARPPTGKALTAAERMRRYRARRRAAGLRSVAAWTPSRAKDEVLSRVELVRTLARAHGAASVELFGSAARGEARSGSDLDFMVELQKGRSLLDLIAFEQDLAALFGCKVDAVSKSALKPRVRTQAERDAIRIL